MTTNPPPPAKRAAVHAQALAAAALLAYPAASLYAGDLRYVFTYSDPFTQAAGVLTAHDNRNGTIAAIAGTLNVSSGSLIGRYSLVENLTGAAVVLSPMNRFYYDDLLFLSSPNTLDFYGLLFYDSEREINIRRSCGTGLYSLWSAGGPGSNTGSDAGIFTLTRADATPSSAPPAPPSPPAPATGTRVPGPGVPVALAGAGMVLMSRRRRR